MTNVSDHCQQIIETLRRGAPVDDPDLLRHAESCPPCADLVADQALLGLLLTDAERLEPAPDLSRLSTGMAKSLSTERGPRAWLSSRPTALRFGLAVVAIVVVLAFVLVATPRVDLGVYPLARLAGTLIVYCAVAVWLALAALAPAQRPLPSMGRRLVMLALAVCVPLLVALSPMAHAAHPASLAGTGADFVPRAIACFSFGSALALPLVLLLWGMDRGASERSQWLVGAGAGIAAVAAVELHCPITQPLHLVAGHATLALGWLLVCALASRVLAARAAS